MISSRFVDTPFAAGVVGSLPRPPAVRDMLPDTPGAESSAAARSPRMDAAVRYAISLQETAGLDLVSDGEWRRHAYTHIVADITNGFSADLREHPRRWGISVTEPLEVVRPGLIAEEASFLVDSSDRMTKVCIPSPYLLGVRLWEREVSAHAYPTRDEFIEALVPILHDELLALSDLGVTVVQIDEPHLCVLVDPTYRDSFEDPQYEMDLAAEKINEVVAGVEGLQLALHLCRRNKGRAGWIGEGGYGPIMPALARLNFDMLMLEFAMPAAGDKAILSDLPERFEIGLGCVDCRSADIDTPEAIAGRVREALKYVRPERVTIHPDCGFAPGSAADIPIDEAYLKLRNEVLAAQILREEYA